jgi:hypothetical protein
MRPDFLGSMFQINEQTLRHNKSINLAHIVAETRARSWKLRMTWERDHKETGDEIITSNMSGLTHDSQAHYDMNVLNCITTKHKVIII